MNTKSFCGLLMRGAGFDQRAQAAVVDQVRSRAGATRAYRATLQERLQRQLRHAYRLGNLWNGALLVKQTLNTIEVLSAFRYFTHRIILRLLGGLGL